MKLIHLSDLHLGKRLSEFNLLEDQEYILKKTLMIIDDEKPSAIIIAGDIYDKAIPSAEAVKLFDDFLCSLAKRGLQVFAISGNHDSPERIAFASRIIDESGIHMSPVYDGKVTPITLTDTWGPVNFYMLPFIKPTHVRRYYPDEEITTYTDALRIALDSMEIDSEARNVLVTHQFVTGASRSDSEEISVGGADNVDASVFSSFDYVALGHLHRPQDIEGSRHIRYCGTPLKYSFSEADHEKSVTVVELAEKGTIDIRTVPLIPKRDLRNLRGSYMELTSKANYEGTNTEDYIHITLTDEEDIPDVMNKLRVIYPNLMSLDYDNLRTRAGGDLTVQDTERKTPLQLFGELYEWQNGQPLSEQQSAFCEDLIEKIWGAEE